MKSIGKYEVIDEIGASATGTKYRARDTFRKREVVLKVLHPIPTLEAAAKDTFCRELGLCAELMHRHLAKILDLGEVEGQVYIATELLSGADLRGLSAGNRELTIAQKIGILAQACEGLAFAHSREIAHGAIPSVLVTRLCWRLIDSSRHSVLDNDSDIVRSPPCQATPSTQPAPSGSGSCR